ncbi:MAG: RluA family pseudouridine synthase [Marinilabiliales bacterium]|nr:RluA family pseudouridine synthase [Marinilabiliales bacterium]
MTQLQVNKSTTLLSFLMDKLTGKSRTTIKSLLRNRQVSVGPHAITQFDYPLEAGQMVTINSGIVPEQTRYRGMRILFEDPYLVVIEKEAGMLSIATAKEKILTTYSMLSHHVKKEDPNNRIFVLHRLDRDTSGVMVFAKSEAIQEVMQKAWQEAIVQRKYIAIVEGNLSTDKGTVHSFLKENKMLVMYSTKIPGEGQEAITHYEVLKRSDDFTLVSVELETGRKNQIRVHMKDLGHPIAGDKKYGSKVNPLQRTCLHANLLAFKHPATGEELSFETPPPSRFLSLFH